MSKQQLLNAKMRHLQQLQDELQYHEESLSNLKTELELLKTQLSK